MPQRLSDFPDLDGHDYGLSDFLGRETAAAAATIVSRVAWCDHERAITALSILHRSGQASFFRPMRSIRNDGERLAKMREAAEEEFRRHPKGDLYKALSDRTTEYVRARNQLAHWLWFADHKQPDFLILSRELHVTTQWIQAQRHMATVKRHFKPRGGTTEAGFKAIKRATIDPPADAVVYSREELERIADSVQFIILGWQKLHRLVMRGSLAMPRARAASWEKHLRRDIQSIYRIEFPW